MSFIIKIAFLLVVIFFKTYFQSLGACNDVTGLHTTSVTHTSATLNWNPVVCDSLLVRYQIAGTGEVRYKIVSNGSAVSVNIDSLYPNTTYAWLVHTYCNNGMSGAYQLAP